MDCTTMKNSLSRTLLNYSILSIAVSPELYSVIIVSTPTHFLLDGRGSSLLLNFQKDRENEKYLMTKIVHKQKCFSLSETRIYTGKL